MVTITSLPLVKSFDLQKVVFGYSSCKGRGGNSCERDAIMGREYCVHHNYLVCQGMTKKGQPCEARRRTSSLYCRDNHDPMKVQGNKNHSSIPTYVVLLADTPFCPQICLGVVEVTEKVDKGNSTCKGRGGKLCERVANIGKEYCIHHDYPVCIGVTKLGKPCGARRRKNSLYCRDIHDPNITQHRFNVP
jgi:hypothetical protein